jgi:hypothetical protein
MPKSPQAYRAQSYKSVEVYIVAAASKEVALESKNLDKPAQSSPSLS